MNHVCTTTTTDLDIDNYAYSSYYYNSYSKTLISITAPAPAPTTTIDLDIDQARLGHEAFHLLTEKRAESGHKLGRGVLLALAIDVEGVEVHQLQRTANNTQHWP